MVARPEDRIQIRCAMFCTTHVLPPVFWTAVEHGRRHHGTAIQRAAEWQRLKRKGVKAGLADLWFLSHGYVCFAELKATTGQSDSQHEFQAKMAALGHGYFVARSVEQLAEGLNQRGIPLAPNWRLAAQYHDAALDGEATVRKRVAKPRAAKPTRRQIAAGNRASLAMARGGA